MDLDELLRVDRWRDMDKLINFEPNPDHSLDAGPDCFLEYCISTTCGILCPENPTGGALLQRAVVLKWFYSLSHRKTFAGGTCTLPSALLVIYKLQISYRTDLPPFVQNVVFISAVKLMR